MHTVMMCCCILHNMVIEDETDADDNYLFDGAVGEAPGRIRPSARDIYHTLKALENSFLHYRCRDDLVQHLWNFHGEEE